MALIEGCDYFVYTIPFPNNKCGGFVTPNDDGTFSVYLNANLSEEENRITLEHELNHILHDDFWRDTSISTIEEEAGA